MPTIQPGTVNLDFYAGADFEFPFTVYEAGVVKNLTGWDARMKARVNYTDAAAVIDLDVAGGGITILGTSGTVVVAMPGADTAPVGAALGHQQTMLVYDIELEDTAGSITRIIQGAITVYPEATR